MANYMKLAQLILKNKGELCNRLEGLTLPSDADKIKHLCIDYVGNLTRKDAEYMNQLSLLEQDLLSPVLKVMDTLYSSDIELSHKISFYMSRERNHQVGKTSKGEKKTVSKEYGPALVGAVGGALLATICKPSSCGVILFGSVISAIIGKVLYSLYVDNNHIKEHACSENVLPEYRLTKEDVKNIIEVLATVGECVDKVLLTYRKHLEILKDDYSRLESTFDLEKKYIGVVECFQSILGNLRDMGDSPVVSDSIRKINQSLQKQGFKAVDYTEDTIGLFNVKRDSVDAVEQFSPAIIKVSSDKETLVLKGDVVIPNK